MTYKCTRILFVTYFLVCFIQYGRMRQLSGDMMSSSNTSSVLLDSGIGGFNSAYPSSSHHSNMSPFTPFFPGGDTVESVIGI